MGFVKSSAFITGDTEFVSSSLFIRIIAVGIAAKDATKHVSGKITGGKNQARTEGIRAGEFAAQREYEKRISDLTDRLQKYHDLDKTIIGLYAIGLAVANADGHICDKERAEIGDFVMGSAAESLPTHVRDAINKLTQFPPSLEKAVQFAIDANLTRSDIQDVIDVVAMADDNVCEHEKAFIEKWNKLATELEIA